MRLNRTDVFATFAVGVGVLVYLFWLDEPAVPGFRSARAVGALVLGLGWLASAVAVVPNVGELIHGSRIYLAVTSLLGVAALTSGVIVLVSADEAMLAVLVLTTAAMWLLATVRHTRAARRAEQAQESEPIVAEEQVTEEREMAGVGR